MSHQWQNLSPPQQLRAPRDVAGQQPVHTSWAGALGWWQSAPWNIQLLPRSVFMLVFLTAYSLTFLQALWASEHVLAWHSPTVCTNRVLTDSEAGWLQAGSWTL